MRGALVAEAREQELEAGLQQVAAAPEDGGEVPDDAVARGAQGVHRRQLRQREDEVSEDRRVAHADAVADAGDGEEAALRGLPLLELPRRAQAQEQAHGARERAADVVEHVLRADHHAAVVERVGDVLAHHLEAVHVVVARVPPERQQDAQQLLVHRPERAHQRVLRHVVELADAHAHAVPELQRDARHFRVVARRALQQELEHRLLPHVPIAQQKVQEGLSHLREEHDEAAELVGVRLLRDAQPRRERHYARHHFLHHGRVRRRRRVILAHDAHGGVAGLLEALLEAALAVQGLEGGVEERALHQRRWRHRAVLHPRPQAAQHGVHEPLHGRAVAARRQARDELENLDGHAVERLEEGAALRRRHVQPLRAALVGDDLDDEEQRHLRRARPGVRRDGRGAAQDVVGKAVPVRLHRDRRQRQPQLVHHGLVARRQRLHQVRQQRLLQA
mmetsp:Transcript_14738/g.44347  ORF Transcript_14738/g.44347 Transcript_14738/m.44347 type:complete len:448 (+) Transcript_14738:1577-2920(+)